VSGLARALELTEAYLDKVALLVVAETSSLTFQADDYAMKNFISCSLFADGAAAVVVGDEWGRKETTDGGRPTTVNRPSVVRGPSSSVPASEPPRLPSRPVSDSSPLNPRSSPTANM